MLFEKGKEITKKLGISGEDLCFSSGWLEKFKNPHGIRCYKTYGKADSSNKVTLNIEIVKLQKQIELYHPNDVYNIDETGLFFRMEPDRTLASRRISGRKKNKERKGYNWIVCECNQNW